MLIVALELVHWMERMHSLYYLNWPEIRMVLLSVANPAFPLPEPRLSWIFVVNHLRSFNTITISRQLLNSSLFL